MLGYFMGPCCSPPSLCYLCIELALFLLWLNLFSAMQTARRLVPGAFLIQPMGVIAFFIW